MIRNALLVAMLTGCGEEACRAAQGLWIPVVLNWMTHVYPNEQEKWGGMDMQMEAGTPDASTDQ